MTKRKTTPPAAGDLSPDYQEHLARQISQSLSGKDKASDAQPDNDTSKTSAAPKPQKRVEGALAAWAGLQQNSDAIEAMLAAQLIVTHELAMTTIGIAVNNSDTSRILFGSKVNDVCKITRANLQQVETLARYRTWRRRTEIEALQLELGDSA